MQIILLWIYPLSLLGAGFEISTCQVSTIMKRRVLRYNAADILGQNIMILPLLSFVESKSWNLSEILVLQHRLLS